VGGIQAFSNVDTANPIDVENGQTTAFALTHAAPSVTTTVANAMLVTAHTLESASTWSPPSGMTEGFEARNLNIPTGQGQSIAASYVLQAAAGASGVKTATAGSDADDGNAHILALRPASAEPKLYFVHVDHLNTPRLVANAAGQTVWLWHQAEPFGNNVPDENPGGLGAFDLPLRFAGQRYDAETGLHYNYYRDYDPSIGRYGESDPIGLRAGPNTYAYVNNRPMDGADRYGLQDSFSQSLANRLGYPLPPSSSPESPGEAKMPPWKYPPQPVIDCRNDCLKKAYNGVLIDLGIHGAGHVMHAMRLATAASVGVQVWEMKAYKRCLDNCWTTNNTCYPEMR
jgi:RHS repeat-associated protein